MSPGFGGDGKAAAGIVAGALLRVDNCAPLPNLEQLRRGPSAVGRDGMDVALAANRFIPEPPTGIHHDAE